MHLGKFIAFPTMLFNACCWLYQDEDATNVFTLGYFIFHSIFSLSFKLKMTVNFLCETSLHSGMSLAFTSEDCIHYFGQEYLSTLGH